MTTRLKLVCLIRKRRIPIDDLVTLWIHMKIFLLVIGAISVLGLLGVVVHWRESNSLQSKRDSQGNFSVTTSSKPNSLLYRGLEPFVVLLYLFIIVAGFLLFLWFLNLLGADESNPYE